VYKWRSSSSHLYTHTTCLLLCVLIIARKVERRRSWFLGLWYLSLGLFVESCDVTLYWLKESVLNNWLLGFLHREGFPGYISCSVIVYLSVILLHAIVNEC
jgi:hypothetical protein